MKIQFLQHVKKKGRNRTGCHVSGIVCTPATHLRGKGSGRCARGLLGVGGDSLRVLRDWLLCTCLSTLLFRSSSVVMVLHCPTQRAKTVQVLIFRSAFVWNRTLPADVSGDSSRRSSITFPLVLPTSLYLP